MLKIARFHQFNPSEIDFFRKKYPHTKWAVAIGNFDGVHLGHQFLLQHLKKYSGQDSLEKIALGVISFYPHPRIFFAKNQQNDQTTTIFQSLQNLHDHADSLNVWAELLFLFNFKALHQKSADEFLAYLAQLNIFQIVIGEDFRCGHQRATSAIELKKLAKAYHIEVEIIPFLVNPAMQGQKISSSGIRLLLGQMQQGALHQQALQSVQKQLGDYFKYTAKTRAGQKLGRTLGFPTFNMRLPHHFILPFGVYASFTKIEGIWYQSITNLGRRPSVDEGCLIETHITDARFIKHDLADLGSDIQSQTQHLTIAFSAYRRTQEKFPTLEALKKAIQDDIDWRKGLNDRPPQS